MKTVLHMLATLAFVGCLSGGALSFVSDWATPLILANEYREKMAAVQAVVPGGSLQAPLQDLTTTPLPENAPEAFLVSDVDGNPLGWALMGVGTGFQDKIHLMVGLSHDLRETRGIKILKDTETPGLGTHIREGEFPDQFFASSGTGLLLVAPLVLVKGSTDLPSEVQAITGATISSRAVMEIVNNAVEEFRGLLSTLHIEGGRP